MNSREFDCDTEDCRFWDEKEGCTRQTPITIQEHCCVDYEEKLRDSILIEVGGGMVQSVYTTLTESVEVVILDFDDNGSRTEKELLDMQTHLQTVASKQQKIY